MCVCVCAPPMILCKSMGSRGVEDKEKRGLRSHLWKLVVGGGHLHILMQLGGRERRTPSSSSSSRPHSLSSICTMVFFPYFALFCCCGPNHYQLFPLYSTHSSVFLAFLPLFSEKKKNPRPGVRRMWGWRGSPWTYLYDNLLSTIWQPCSHFPPDQGWPASERERERGQPVQHTHSKSEIIINRIGYINWKNPLRLAQHI